MISFTVILWADYEKKHLNSNWLSFVCLFCQSDGFISGIESILDLKGRKIAVLQNDVYFLNLRSLVKQFGISCRFIEAFEYDDVLKLVEIGKCDAGLVNYLFGHQFERDYDINKSSIILSPQKIHFAVPKGKNKAIVNALDHHLGALKMDGGSIYHQSLSKWIGVESKSPSITWLLWISAGALSLFLIVLFLNLVLRAKVRQRTWELNIKNQALLEENEQRKKAEYALQENEKEYRSVFENTGTATILVEEDMTISKVNAKAEELAGYSKSDIEGQIKTIDFVAEEDRARIIQYHKERRKQDGEYPSEYTFELVDKHGNTKNVFIQTSMIPGTKRSIASIIDITSRVQAETALRRSEEKYRTILENIEEGYFELDLDGNLIFFNNSLCKITGHSREELMGGNYRVYSSPETAEKWFQVFNQRDIASKILSQLGYSVNTAKSGEEAVAFLKQDTVDLIVLDMIMSPGIDGLETYERIIELHPMQKAIIASGYSETERVKKAQQLGAGKYVKKPYTVQKIGLAVKAELERQPKAA